jgi:hypothetical protein
VGCKGHERRTRTHSALVDARLANVSRHVAKLIVSLDGWGDRGRRGAGERETVVDGLIRLSYRYRRGCCMEGSGRIMRRVGRQACRTPDRRRKYKVVKVHRVCGWLWLRYLRLPLGRASQLLGDAARSGPGCWPCARCSGRRHQCAVLAALGNSTYGTGQVSRRRASRTARRLR